MKKKIELCMALLLLVGAIVVSFKLSELVAKVSSGKVEKEEVLLVIDPGHGGEDPGKVGVNGTLEKELNLQIAIKLQEKLEEDGIQVVLTRKDDLVPKAKKEDLQKRVDLINEIQPTMVVCIHQNSFTDASVNGAQVFYHGDSEVSEEIAYMIQDELKLIDENNQREIKGNESYFMLSNTKVPTVIVECGFLSNAEDEEKLKNEDYQEAISGAISSGIRKWLDKYYK